MSDQHLLRIAKALDLKVGKFCGSGIHMAQQTYSFTLTPGDWAWDADWGYLMWTGKDWHPFVKEQNKQN